MFFLFVILFILSSFLSVFFIFSGLVFFEKQLSLCQLDLVDLLFLQPFCEGPLHVAAHDEVYLLAGSVGNRGPVRTQPVTTLEP